MGAYIFRPPRRTPRGGTPAGGPPPAGSAAQPLTDLAAFPILTEEIGYPPSPLAKGIGTPTGGTGTTNLGQTAMRAVADVLGWKVRTDDPKGFMGALTQSFTLTDSEGHVDAKWIQRSYAMQSDLSGGISGAQASLYTRAKYALDESMPLLDGLYCLNPEATPEDVESVREVVRSQITQLVAEFAFPSGPRISRVNQYFTQLLLTPPPYGTSPQRIPTTPSPAFTVITNSDTIWGTLGNLRDVFGVATSVPNPSFSPPGPGGNPQGPANTFFSAVGTPETPIANPLINSIADETNTTNFRVISDYLTSLFQTWLNNLQYFVLGTTTGQTFLGTQLVLISRQLSVTSELVDEVRFTLDSVFLGPAERQTMLLNFPLSPQAAQAFPGSYGNPVNSSWPTPPASADPVFLEDLLSWLQTMVTEEAPPLISTGGKFGVYQVAQTASQQYYLLYATQVLAQYPSQNGLPLAFSAPRVTIALQNLTNQLAALANLAQPVSNAYLPVNPS
jgi:hypothetical protein